MAIGRLSPRAEAGGERHHDECNGTTWLSRIIYWAMAFTVVSDVVGEHIAREWETTDCKFHPLEIVDMAKIIPIPCLSLVDNTCVHYAVDIYNKAVDFRKVVVHPGDTDSSTTNGDTFDYSGETVNPDITHCPVEGTIGGYTFTAPVWGNYDSWGHYVEETVDYIFNSNGHIHPIPCSGNSRGTASDRGEDKDDSYVEHGSMASRKVPCCC